MTGREYLDYLKDKPFLYEIIWNFDIRDVIDLATAWPMSRPQMDKEILENSLPDEDGERFSILWSGVIFSRDLLQRSVRHFVDENLFRRLVESRMIYPDGTYNESAVQLLINKGDMKDA